VESNTCEDIQSALASLLNPSNLSALIACAVALDAPSEGEGPRTALLHVRFKEDEPKTEALAEFLWQQCMYYALPRKRRLEFTAEIEKDFSVVARVHQIVRNTFIRFNESYPSRASEVGEVLAYCVVQHHLLAAQVAAKMALKTSPNMPVHGLDGIHAAFQSGALTIFFLESKLAGSANSGIKEYAKSAAGFLSDRGQYLREYELISDLGHFDSLEGSAREAALDFFDIVGKPDLPRRERSVGVICYSEKRRFNDKLPVSDGPVTAHEEHFASRFRNDHKRHRRAANKHIKAAGANTSKCLLFLVAVPDVNDLRKAFYRAMGVEVRGDDIPDTPEDDEDIEGDSPNSAQSGDEP
jgi:hypothetical protein